MFKVPEEYRQKHGLMGSNSDFGNNGLFVIHAFGYEITCIASDGLGWEHVSVSINRQRVPTWEVMCLVKEIFWDDEDCVVQYHPPKSQYVNVHPYVLHLWRKADFEYPLPWKGMV